MKYTCWCEWLKEQPSEEQILADCDDFLEAMRKALEIGERRQEDLQHHAWLEGRNLSRATTRELPTESELPSVEWWGQYLADEYGMVEPYSSSMGANLRRALIKWMEERHE